MSTMCQDDCSDKLQLPTKECVDACPENYFLEGNTCVLLCGSSLYRNGVCELDCQYIIPGQSNQFECVDDCPDNKKYHLGHLCVSSCAEVNAQIIENSEYECAQDQSTPTFWTRDPDTGVITNVSYCLGAAFELTHECVDITACNFVVESDDGVSRKCVLACPKSKRFLRPLA